MSNYPTLRLVIGISNKDIDDYLLVCESFGFIRCETIEDITAAIKHERNAIYGNVSLATLVGRKSILQSFKDKANIEGIIIAQPAEYCSYNNVTDDLIKSFQTPLYEEGFNNIGVFYPDDTDKLYGHWSNWIKSVMNYNQFNSHHKYTLGEHCLRCKMGCESYNGVFKDELIIASALHDVGKPYTQTFDENGEAHYHHHTNIGAYNCLFYDCDNADKLIISQIISNHTDPKRIRKLAGNSSIYNVVKYLYDIDIMDSN